MDSSSSSSDLQSSRTCLGVIRESRKTILLIVFLALLTDSMMLTLVDPILPDMLSRIEKLDQTTNSSLDLTDAINDNGRYGYLVASKGAAQFLFNPVVGVLVTIFGYRRPMVIGDVVLMLSTLAFTYSASYLQLLLCRILQGISSAITAVTGMSLLAATYTDEEERSRAMGTAIGGLSFGIIVGPVYGSLLYEFVGRDVPFLLLAATIFVLVVLQLITMKKEKPTMTATPVSAFFTLLSDPLILIVAGNIFLLNLDVSIVLAFLPVRLMELDDPATWQLGIVVLPTSIGYLFASVIFPRLSFVPRWVRGLIGLDISVACLVTLGFVTSFEGMLVVTTFLGLALGMVSTAMQPIFAHLVDIKYGSMYGNVYAISDMSVCAAMFVGPLVGGVVVFQFGFEWLVWGTALMNGCFSLFSILLRQIRTPSRDNSYNKADEESEKTFLISKG